MSCAHLARVRACHCLTPLLTLLLTPWLIRRVPTLLLAALLGVPAAVTAQTPPKPAARPGAAPITGKTSGEVTTFKRPELPKDDKKDDQKKAPGPGGPEQRRTRERSSAEDIDDELSILRELLDIERGSETEADTLLEISYVLWDRAEAYELEAYDERYEIGIAKLKEAGEKQQARRLEVEQQSLLEQGRAAKLDVISHLKRIERNFPRYGKLDEVLYSLGFHLNELERPGEAVDAFMRLVRKVPKSNFLPDAYLGIGNYYFGKNQGGEALKWYAKVAEFPDSAVYGWGLYYIAWVQYNQQAWDAAVKGFIRVLDYSKNEARGRVSFVEDASRYLVRSWAEIGNPKNSLKFFKQVAPGVEVMLLDQLALYYAEVSQYENSNIALDDLIDFARDDAQMLRYLTQRLDNSFKQRDVEQTVKSALMVSNELSQHGKTLTAVLPQLELLLAEIGSTYHAESERTLDDHALNAAEKVYRVYEEHFGDGKFTYDMTHNHALALFQLGQRAAARADVASAQKKADIAAQQRELANGYFKEAAGIYEKVIALQPEGKYAAASAHRSLISYLQLQNLNAETGVKGVDTADLRAQALGPDEQRVADACQRYVIAAKYDKTDDDVMKALFIEGRLYYQHNQFDQAGEKLSKFVEIFADSSYAVQGAALMLSAYNLNQDGKALILWTNKLIGDARFNQGELGKTLTEIKSNEEYNKCLELKDDPVRAAQCLTKYAETFPENRVQAARALAGAARFYRQAKKRDDIIATYKKLAAAFPDDPRAPQSIFEIAEIFRECADFDAAATAYEDYVKAYPQHEKVPQALSTATRIRESLGQFDKVVEDGELFLQHFSKDERAVQVAFKLTTQYIKKGDWKGVVTASEKFTKRGLNIPTELQLATAANMGLAQFKLLKGDKGKKFFDEVIKRAVEMAGADQLKGMPEVGRDAIAQALFMNGELEFEKVKAIKGAPKDLKAATELITKKITAAKPAEAFYGQVEDSKNARWIAAAASRRGKIFQEIAASIQALPPPPALARSEELKSEWAAQLADKARPHNETAVARYREALRKSAESFAFDSYWAEARDSLKTLDTKFAEQVDIKEFMVELVPYKWTDAAKPLDAIRDLRTRLFTLSSGVTVEDGKVAAETVKEAGPEVAQAWFKLAAAHHAAGQHREALVVGAVGMLAAPELKKLSALWNVLALSHLALGNTREALLAFKEAGRVDEKATEPLLNAASVTARSLGFSETVELLDEVLKRDGDNYWARVTRPVALRRSGDDPEKTKTALQALDELAKSSDRPEGHYNRCVIAQATLTNGKPELQQALTACKDSLSAVGTKHTLSKELQKRVKGLEDTISFMP
ncbi:MAG: tetratricopeptide repeat protein [Myxococcales bacterium]|nr:tetratricopeptide repeat protein [Myxococcales bacterium]